jgi:acetyl/propionyl-CoA carboxylase alpha subunit
MKRLFRLGGIPGSSAPAEISVRLEGDRAEVDLGGRRHRLELIPRADGTFVGIFGNGRVLRSRVSPRKRGTRIRTRGQDLLLDLFDPREEPSSSAGASMSSEVSAAMPGRVVEVKVRTGDRVRSGDVLLILEAMKMQNEIRAESEGVVASIDCQSGQAVETGAILVRFEAER